MEYFVFSSLNCHCLTNILLLYSLCSNFDISIVNIIIIILFRFVWFVFLKMLQYSNQEKFDMIRCLILRQSNSTNAARFYLESYPERRQPSSRLFRVLKSNLIQYGAFVKPKKEPREIDPDKENIVLGCVQEEPTTSVREIERNTGIPKSSAQVILRKHRYHPY